MIWKEIMGMNWTRWNVNEARLRKSQLPSKGHMGKTAMLRHLVAKVASLGVHVVRPHGVSNQVLQQPLQSWAHFNVTLAGDQGQGFFIREALSFH